MTLTGLIVARYLAVKGRPAWNAVPTTDDVMRFVLDEFGQVPSLRLARQLERALKAVATLPSEA